METKQAMVFDVNAAITLKLLSPDGERKIRVRFPTDQEWADRARKREIYIKQLGRGISETQAGHAAEVNTALLAAIREARPGRADRARAEDGECQGLDPVQALLCGACSITNMGGRN